MDFWIPLLGGAVGAAIINSLIALYKIRRDKRIQHSQWMRDQKLEAYDDFITEVHKFLNSNDCGALVTEGDTKLASKR